MVGFNGYEAIEKATGINVEEQKKILNEVKENHRKLNSCNNHNFVIEIPGHTKYDTRYQCSNCQGIVNSNMKKWYELGRLHEARLQKERK